MKTEYRKLEERVPLQGLERNARTKRGMLWVDQVADRRS
jgi:hypothetical protein